jgi:hypothetical protein
MNLGTKFRLQAALALVVAGALPQLAHAGSQGPLATDAHDRAPVVQSAASHYTPQALKAMGARYQAMADAYAKRSAGTASRAATSVPKSSPYYYGGNVAPVTTKKTSGAATSVPKSSPYYYGGNVAPVTTKTAHATTRQYDVGGTLVFPDATNVRPDDRAALRGVDPVQPVITPDPSGFDWGDATIGAAGGAGAALLLIGATLIAMLGRRQRVATQ